MRQRGGMSGDERDAQFAALEEQLALAKKMLVDANIRNQRLVSLVTRQYGVGGGSGEKDQVLSTDVEDGSLGSLSVSPSAVSYSETDFFGSLWDRGTWLASLLLFQSFSSFILSHHEVILKQHPSIVYYLTALVGAGGNAGNQAAVRVIRLLALGLVTDKNKYSIMWRELFVSLALSVLLGAVVVGRTFLSSTTVMETVVILSSICLITFISINLGAAIPLILDHLKICDPAHSSTSIQVVMDISGVLITCRVAQWLVGE